MTAKEQLRQRVEAFSEDEAALAEARADIAAGRTVPLDEAMRELE
ncbi:MAG: hypothetical protein ACRDPA_12395 [Solirubrobacteraceae bacterium]